MSHLHPGRSLPLLALVAASTAAQTPSPAPSAEPVVTSLAVFAGTRDKLWRSRDWGSSWEPVTARLSEGATTPIAGVRCLLPIGPRVYAGGEQGLLVSDDFGTTWSLSGADQPVVSLLPSRYPQADPTLFLGTSAGLLKSDNLGRSFRSTPLSGATVFQIAWPGPALVVATARGVLVSQDAGASFEGPGTNLPEGEVRAMALSSFYPVDPVLFAGVAERGVYRSSDGGKSWAAAGLEGRRVNDLYWLGPFLYAATSEGLFRSEDLGRNWTPLNEGLTATPQRLLFPLAPESGAVIFVGTDSGVFRSSDGGLHWRPSGLKGEDVLSIGTFPPPERMQNKQNKRKR